jgi:phenylalanyl-tRNA synthetase beta chain
VKITYHWMREFTPLTVTPAELAAQLTLAGLEVEAVSRWRRRSPAWWWARCLSAGRHPNAEKLSLCEVTTDGNDRLQIVCGAPNVRGGSQGGRGHGGRATCPATCTSSARSCAGSNRTACCARRASWAWATSTTASWSCRRRLPLGVDVRTALDLDDTALEVNATPNRGDCMSVFGIARDYTAAQEQRYLTCVVPPVPARSDRGVPGEHQNSERSAGIRLRA